MKKSGYIFIKAILLLIIGDSYEYDSNQMITVSFYYSTFSAASKNFIVNQLFPTYSRIGQHLKLDLLPYGVNNISINENGIYVFECFRGPEDCEGNIIQSCALNQTEDDHTKLQFVYCYMMNAKHHNAANFCAKEADLNSQLISKCRNENGKDILLHYAERIHQELPEKFTLPKVKLDGKFVAFTGTNFIGNLCALLKGTPECRNIPVGTRHRRESKNNYTELEHDTNNIQINNLNTKLFDETDNLEKIIFEQSEDINSFTDEINNSTYLEEIFTLGNIIKILKDIGNKVARGLEKIIDISSSGKGEVVSFNTTNNNKRIVRQNFENEISNHNFTEDKNKNTLAKPNDLMNKTYYLDMLFNPNSTKVNGIPTYNVYVEDTTKAPAIEEIFDFDEAPKSEPEETNPSLKNVNIPSGSVLGLGKESPKVIGEKELKNAEGKIPPRTPTELGEALPKTRSQTQNEGENQQQNRIKTQLDDQYASGTQKANNIYDEINNGYRKIEENNNSDITTTTTKGNINFDEPELGYTRNPIKFISNDSKRTTKKNKKSGYSIGERKMGDRTIYNITSYNISGLAEGLKKIFQQNKKKTVVNNGIQNIFYKNNQHYTKIDESKSGKEDGRRKLLSNVFKRQTTTEESGIKDGKETVFMSNLFTENSLQNNNVNSTQLSPELGEKITEAINEDKQNHNSSGKVNNKRQIKIEQYDVKEKGETVKEYKITGEKMDEMQKALEDLLKSQDKEFKKSLNKRKDSFEIVSDVDNSDEKLAKIISETIKNYKEKPQEPTEYSIEETKRKFYSFVDSEKSNLMASSDEKEHKPL